MYEYSPVGATIAEYGPIASAATIAATVKSSSRRAGGGCCDDCSCRCVSSGCCPDCAARGVKRGGQTAMRGLGATTADNVIKTIAIPAFTVAQPPPGALTLPLPQQSSPLPMLLLLGGLGVAGFLIVKRIRAGRAAAPASNPRRRRR